MKEYVATIIWVEFKAFFRKNHGQFIAFINSIWSRVKEDSQNQLEKTQEWGFHFKRLQSILLEFDADGALEESDITRFFRIGD